MTMLHRGLLSMFFSVIGSGAMAAGWSATGVFWLVLAALIAYDDLKRVMERV